MRERVAIIGAGPAGCSAALKCSQLGLPVVLFEAAGRYRDKPCGDALVANAVTYARTFGLSDADLLSMGGQQFAQIDVTNTRSPSARLRIPHPGGWVIPRAAFDQALRDAISCKCDVRYNTAIRHVRPTSCGIALVTSRSCDTTEYFDAAIIATGATSRFSQMLGIDGRPRKGLAFRAYLRNPDSRDALSFEFTGGPTMQYRWVFPMNERANIGVCRLDECISESTCTVKAALLTLAGNSEVTKLSGGVQPLWTGNARNWHHPSGVVSCGDCAGLVNPMTGEGITAAFVSGDMAACAIASYLGSQGAFALEQFSDQVADVFSQKYGAVSRKEILSLLAFFRLL
jgi:flavin-dependent dehydrogenase